MKAKSPSIHRLAEVQALAIETFGSKTMADEWLNRENFALGAKSWLSKTEQAYK